MAATSLNRSYDALLSLTADNYYKAGIVHDGVFKSNPTFAELYKKGMRKETVGGSKIQVNLMYGKNTSVDSYDRYGLINTAPQDGMTPAFYDWAQYAGSVSIDGLSEFQNSGKPAIQKLLREKVKQLTMSFSEKMNEDLFDIEGLSAAGVTGNNGKNLVSIPLLVQGNPTDGQDVGSIDQSVETWWQNQTKNATDAGTWLNLGMELRTLYNDCSKGSGGAPDLIIVDQTTFENYEAGMDQKIRYEYTDKASIGFESIKFKAAKLMWDEHVPDPETGVNWDSGSIANGAAYMLNTKNLELVVGKGKDFKPLGFQQPVNQDARTGLWVFYGQLVANNRRKLGVLEDIDYTIAS